MTCVMSPSAGGGAKSPGLPPAPAAHAPRLGAPVRPQLGLHTGPVEWGTLVSGRSPAGHLGIGLGTLAGDSDGLELLLQPQKEAGHRPFLAVRFCP